MSDLDLAAVEARAAAATDGPWEWVDPGGSLKQALVHPTEWSQQWVVPAAMGDVYPSHADAEFIAHARTDIPNLIARIRHLEKLLEYPVDGQGRKLFCPRCGGPDTEGYPREVLDA